MSNNDFPGDSDSYWQIPGDQHPTQPVVPPQPKPSRHPIGLYLVAAIVLVFCAVGGIITAVAASRVADDNKGTKAPAITVPDSGARPTPNLPTATPTPTPTVKAPAPAATTTAPKPVARTYAKLTAREWKLVAKNPDRYTGKRYIVYGSVTQFDSATGDDTFRANVGHANATDRWDYTTNTVLTGDADRLSSLVEDDEFKASVVVAGSYDYETQIGGNTTVPMLTVEKITRL